MDTKRLEWLDREIKKDELEIESSKKKMIQSITKIDKELLYTEPKKPKLTFTQKLLKIIGYGRKY